MSHANPKKSKHKNLKIEQKRDVSNMLERAGTTLFVRDGNFGATSENSMMLRQLNVRLGQLVPFPGQARRVMFLGGYTTSTVGSSVARMGDYNNDFPLLTLDLDSLTTQSAKITNVGSGDYTPSLGYKGTAHTVNLSDGTSLVCCSGGVGVQPRFPFELQAEGTNLRVRFLDEDITALRALTADGCKSLNDLQGCRAVSCVHEGVLIKWGGVEGPEVTCGSNGRIYHPQCLRLIPLGGDNNRVGPRHKIKTMRIVGKYLTFKPNLGQGVFDGTMFHADGMLIALGVQTKLEEKQHAKTIYFFQRLDDNCFMLETQTMRPKFYGSSYVQIRRGKVGEIWAITWNEGDTSGKMVVTSIQYDATNFNDIKVTEEDFALDISSPNMGEYYGHLSLLRSQTAALYDR